MTFPQASQIDFFIDVIGIEDLATNTFIPVVDDDNELMGDLAFNYLASEANTLPGQIYSDWLGYSPLSGCTHHDTDPYLAPASPSSSATSPSAMDFTSVSPLSPSSSPSPSPSQASSATEDSRGSPEPLPLPLKPSCHEAVPIFNRIRGKWCCGFCDKAFVGSYECKRHISTAGVKVECRGCGHRINVRDDSLTRHFQKHCEKNLADLSFEDSFTEA